MTGGSLRGTQGRRIQYWPVTGRARQMMLDNAAATVFAAERQVRIRPQETGGVELF